MNLSVFNPAFTGSIFDVLDRNFTPNKTDGFPQFAFSCRTVPNADVRETGKAYLIDIDLPGYKENEIEINLNDRILTISSLHEEVSEKNEDGSTYIIRERSSKKFSRRFTLPEDINNENVSADFENGVLKITVPRKADTKPRQIPINKK